MIEQYSKYNEQQIKGLLKNSNVEVRFAAAYVVGEKKVPLPREMIGLLQDANVSVQQASRRSLILLACHATGPKKPCEQLTRQVNSLLKVGPEPTAKQKALTKAVDKWTTWWDENDPQLLKLVNASRAGDQKDAAVPPAEKRPANLTMSAEPQNPEEAAQAKLKLAQILAKDGLEQKARTHYEEIIQQYPKTKAAQQARNLLDMSKPKNSVSPDAGRK
jgi:hypothetical protein